MKLILDILSNEEKWEEISNLLRKRFKFELHGRSTVFAFLIVPFSTFMYWVNHSEILKESSGEIGIVAESLNSSLHKDQGAKTSNGEIFLFPQASAEEFVLEFENEIEELHTTVSANVLNINVERIKLSSNEVRIKTPLLGSSEPFIVASTTNSKLVRILAVGKTIERDKIDRISLFSSNSVTIWALLASVFGFGLTCSGNLIRETELV